VARKTRDDGEASSGYVEGSRWQRVSDILFFRLIGSSAAFYEVGISDSFRREVLLFAIWCFFIPEALRGRRSDVADMIRQVIGRDRG
jgi:hypothetical protein